MEYKYLDTYELGKEEAMLAITKLLQRGPMGSSVNAGEFRRGYNEVIKKAISSFLEK